MTGQSLESSGITPERRGWIGGRGKFDGAVAEAVPATDIQRPEAAVLDAERRRTFPTRWLGVVRTRIRAGMIAMRQRLEHAV